MLKQLFATKKHMSQTFVEGKRVPVTILGLPKQVITQVKDKDTDGYTAVQVAIGQKNSEANKPTQSHLKKAKIKKQPRWIREIRVKNSESFELKPGDELPLTEIVKSGDLVDITGKSLGKGFTGVVKRYGFGGGPRTHGQSDRMRAPGSIGRGTTPGRVLPGKKMPGHMGDITKTIENLKIVDLDLDKQQIKISGPVPGHRNSLLRITIVKKAKTK